MSLFVVVSYYFYAHIPMLKLIVFVFSPKHAYYWFFTFAFSIFEIATQEFISDPGGSDFQVSQFFLQVFLFFIIFLSIPFVVALHLKRISY